MNHLVYFLDPPVDSIERPPIGDVVNKQYALD